MKQEIIEMLKDGSKPLDEIYGRFCKTHKRKEIDETIQELINERYASYGAHWGEKILTPTLRIAREHPGVSLGFRLQADGKYWFTDYL
jgi:hypothetical protein